MCAVRSYYLVIVVSSVRYIDEIPRNPDEADVAAVVAATKRR